VCHTYICKVIGFGSNNKSNATSYTLQGGALEDVNKYKYLGVWVEKSLKWLEHIKYITNKGRRRTLSL
jgi:hypothetical protein